jgi:2-amino-4-hydroxy-6-hydroxymethyldihydropteridine diphosphokinase
LRAGSSFFYAKERDELTPFIRKFEDFWTISSKEAREKRLFHHSWSNFLIYDWPVRTSNAPVKRSVPETTKEAGQNMAFVAIGSNLGNSRKIVSDALARLQKLSDKPILKSSLWQTSPVHCPPGSPNFVNAVAGLVPKEGETPESFLKKLRGLEKEFGRAPKKIQNEPRPLDLDLISFGSETRDTPDLTLPHPRAHLRKFVLAPLNEIAPELIFAGQGRAVSKLLAEVISSEVLVKLDSWE